MSPADVRHLRRMLACISAVRSGGASLVEGANSLLFLRDALDATEEAWTDEFTSHVATLESAGLATQEQVTAMGGSYASVVANVIDTLEAMVRGRFPGGTLPDETDEDS
jgi:hypothetical protein